MIKKKKVTWLFYLYIVIGIFGLAEAILSETILQCIILIMISLFTILGGFIIKKYGTVDSVW